MKFKECFMKKKLVFWALLVWVLVSGTIGCSTVGNLVGNVTMPSLSSDLGNSTSVPKDGETVIIVRRLDSEKEAVNIFVDGRKILILNKNEEGRYILANGNHVISAEIPNEQKIKGTSYNVSAKEFRASSSTIRFDLLVSTSSQRVIVNISENSTAPLR